MNRTLLFVMVFLAAPLARAHHGAGTFELHKTIPLSGKLTPIHLNNPPSCLYFESTAKDGRMSRYRCEMRSVHVLRRSGWSKDLFPIGQQINVEASADRACPNSCYLQTI